MRKIRKTGSYVIILICVLAASCSSSKKISSNIAIKGSGNIDIAKEAEKDILSDSNLLSAHIGISIYDPAEKKYLYNYQGDKFFIPASNMKLFMCYAAMKYLGDSLVGLKVTEYDDRIVLYATGDPTLLHPDFPNQPVIDFLSKTNKPLWGSELGWKEEGLGSGWSWNDYSDDYMAERSALPIYGNVVRFSGMKNDIKYYPAGAVNDNKFPVNGLEGYVSAVKREFYQNNYTINVSGRALRTIEVPFITSSKLSFQLLADVLKKKIIPPKTFMGTGVVTTGNPTILNYVIHSQATDSLLKITMHRSDNFYAEQTLLMVSNAKLGIMNDAKIIDTLLKTDLKGLPQKPKWVDGSGLSRYNLVSPQDFVALLEKMKNEFSWTRISTILETGGTGTLNGYYKNYAGRIYAKTGSLSNNIALSGYITTQKGKQLIFSVLVSNHLTGAANVRRAVEKFLSAVMDMN